MRIGKVRREDDGFFSCTILEDKLTGTYLSQSVNVVVYKPASLSFKFADKLLTKSRDSIKIVVGTKAMLTCHAEGSNPGVDQLKVYLDGVELTDLSPSDLKPLEMATEFRQYETSVGGDILILPEYNNQKLACIATGPNNAVTTVSFNLEVITQSLVTYNAEMQQTTVLTHGQRPRTTDKDDAAGCGVIFTSKDGEVTSPNYPSNYPGNKQCENWIQAPYGYTTKLEFKDFHLEEDDISCRYDSLTIFDGKTDSDIQLEKLCGQRLPAAVVSTGRDMYLKFKSDTNTNSKGFRATYVFVRGTDYTTVSPNGGFDTDEEPSSSLTPGRSTTAQEEKTQTMVTSTGTQEDKVKSTERSTTAQEDTLVTPL